MIEHEIKPPVVIEENIYHLTIKDCKQLQLHGQLHSDYWDLWRDPHASWLGGLNKLCEFAREVENMGKRNDH